MNATEAAALATKVITTEQQYAAEAAMSQIRQAAEQGKRSTTLYPKRPDWLRTYLEGEGYQIDHRVSGNQMDGPMLLVSW